MISPRRATAWSLAALLVAGASAAAPAVYADSGDPPGFLATLGGPGHAMIYPSGGEIAPDGTIVVADTGNDRVAKFSADGLTQVWTIGTPGKLTGQFLEPRDAGIDSLGNIFIADTGNARIVKLSPTGTWITSFKGPTGSKLASPIGISITNDVIYVADGLQKKVYVFGLAGNLLLQVASNGICSFSRIRDADADAAGNIYVADYLNDDILKLSPSGVCITKWGTFGSGSGQFKNPYGVRLATDPVLGAQAVYVADSNNNRIQEFTTAGVYVATIGGPGVGPGTFTQLRRVAVATDGTGDVWGADPWGFQMEKFHRTPTGYTWAQTIGAVPPSLTSTQVFNQPHGISFDTAGNIAVVDTVNQRIVEMTPTGSIIGACGQRGFGKAEDNWPRGVAIDQTTGQLWIADTKQSRLIILNPAPGCSSVVTIGAGQGTALNQFHWPFSIAIRQSDRIAWIADTKNNRITSFNVMTRMPIATFGTLGSGTGQFNSPSGIAVVPGTGHVLVADTLNNRVVELSDTGGAAITVVRTLTDSLSGPQGVGADSLGQIYVADTNNNRVVVLDPTGTERGTLSGFNQPQNLAVNATNSKLYVADTLNDRVQVYSYPTAPPPGPPTYVSTLVGPGLASMYPVDVTSTATYYYVMDPGRYRVSRIVRSTGLIDLETSGGQGSGPSQFSDARAIDVDSAGNVYVADTANNRVQVFDKDLNFMRQWGSSGSGNGQFTQDYGLGIGMGIGAGGLAAEVAYITDGTGRVQKFDLNGTYLGQFSAILNQPRQITVDAVNQQVFVMDARNRRVVVFDKNGTQLFAFGSSGTGPGQFSDDPRGIGVTADGTKAFATDSGGKRVLVFNAITGGYLYQVGGPGPGAGLFVNPRGLTVTADGMVLVSDEFGYGVHEFTLDGTPVRDLFGNPPPIPGADSPRGVEVAASGRIFNVDWWNQRIDSINPNGSSPSAFGFRGTTSQPGSINFAWDLAIQPGTDRIFVANRESHEIEVFESNGTYVTRWGTRGTANGQIQFPQGDTFAPDGTLLVSDTGNGRIERFSIDSNGNGTWVATYGAQGLASQGVGFLNIPTGISTASDGTIWVADTLNNSVQSMSPLGVWTRYTSPGGTHLRAPWGITVAPDSSIWISDTGNAQIVKMENNGIFDWAATGPQMGAGAISPFGVAFGQGKHVYLSDTWHNRVIDLVTN